MKEEDLIYSAGILCSKWINLFKRPQKLNFQSILVVKLDEIGDMVNALHVFDLLKQSYPHAGITVWCKPFNRSLLQSDPSIDRIINDKKELDKHYDLIVELRGNWESIRYALGSKPLYRLDRGRIRLRNKFDGGQKHEVETNFQIIEPVLKARPEKIRLKLHYPEVAVQKADNYIRDEQIPGFAVLHCGARRVLRQWKGERFAALAVYLKQKYAYDIVFAGDAKDIPQIEKIQSLIPFKTFSIAPQFSLIEFAALVSKANIFVGNESGPLHIAAASGVKVIGLYGPGVPVTFYPYGDNSRYIHHVLDCNPCDQIHCVRPECPCIDLITLEEVKMKLHELLDN